MGIRFDAASRTEVLERLFRERSPRRLVAKLEGPAAGISSTVIITTFEGRIIEARAGHHGAVDALTVLALADGGEIESSPEPPPTREAARYPDGIGLYRQAASNAAEIASLLAPLGGLAASPISDLDLLVTQLEQIPDAANVVLRLIDNRSTTAELLARSPHDLRLTARILQRLAASSIVVPPATVAPEPIDEPIASEAPLVPGQVVAPAPDEMEGEAVNADVQHWLAEEEPPPPLLSPDAFRSAFEKQTPERMMTPKPGTRAPLPEPSPAIMPPRTLRREEEDEFFREAGVGKTSMLTWALLAVAGIVLGIGASFLLAGPDSNEPIDTGMIAAVVPDAMTSTTSTVATASIAAGLGPDGRPPIAGPDAPEDVKRAERLLNQGRYQDARDLLEQLRKTRPTDETVWILSGQVECDVGRLMEADSLADRALELNPKSYRAWVLKGSVLQFRGRFTQAQSAYQKALALDPKHPMTPEIQSVLEQMEKTINR